MGLLGRRNQQIRKGAGMTEKPILIAAVEESTTGTYTKAETLSLIKSVSTDRDVIEVEQIRRGDVFWHKLVGGKMRPWIALHVNEHSVVAVCLSGGETAAEMTKADCRFWPGDWIGNTISIFRPEEARRAVTRPFTNAQQLADVEAKLIGIFSGERGEE